MDLPFCSHLLSFDISFRPVPNYVASWTTLASQRARFSHSHRVSSFLIINRRDGLYGPLQAQGSLHEQRKTIQACFGAGLLLCGGLYVVHDTTVARGFVAYFIALTTAFLCVLRWFWRRSLYRKYQRGIDTKNVLIVGTSHNVVRKQIKTRPSRPRLRKIR
jgi:FlaA1/EpsC-like NDP-sugar epimerase